MGNNSVGNQYVVEGKASKGQTRGVYFDKAKFEKLIKKHGGTLQDFAEQIGRSNTWVYNCRVRGTMAMVDALAIKAIYKVDLIIDHPYEEPKKEKPKTTEAVIKCDIRESDKPTNAAGYLLIDKLDAVNKNIETLGKIQAGILKELMEVNEKLDIICAPIVNNKEGKKK